MDPKGFVRDLTESVSNYADDVVGSVAKNASKGAPVAKPGISLPKAEISWSAPAYDLSGRVVKVSERGTITLLDAEQEQHEVRLHGIDIPEYQQPHGRRAINALAKLVAGEGVGVDMKNTDRDGRALGVVYKDNINVNLEMVRNGHAWWYKKYAPFDDDLELAQQRARADKLGLWAEPDPLSPWEWRRANR